MDDNVAHDLHGVWNELYEELKETPWESTDLAAAIEGIAPITGEPVVHALKYVYDAANNWTRASQEAAVNAVLTACTELQADHAVTPAMVREVADNFAIFYEDADEPLQDHLDSCHEELPLSWLSEHGREELTRRVRKGSELWLDEEHLPGIWVFKRPGR